MHMMGESSNTPVMGGIVPTSLEMAIALLPVYPVRHGFDGIRSANNKFERFEKVSVGQRSPDAYETFLRVFLSFSHLKRTHHRRKEKQTFHLIEMFMHPGGHDASSACRMASL
jgi:hypothetical protein